MTDLSTLYQRPAEMLQTLIRFDTTNPPGNEYLCIDYLNHVMTQLGFETTVLGRNNTRPNLIVRIKGEGKAQPLLLHGHVDVVTTANQVWTHPPFEGVIADGYVWGRGALDMKSGVVLILCALMRAKAEGITFPGDIITTILSDEEYEGYYGAGFLVDEHAHLFDGVRYSIGEGGAGSYYFQDKKFYPITVAEKQVCWMTLTVRGKGGHASLPHRGGTMAKLAQVLHTLDTRRLPVHITKPVEFMVKAYANALDEPVRSVMQALLNPTTTDSVLDQLGEYSSYFDALLHNTVNATIVRGGHQTNVIPSEATLELDGRLLPGFTDETLFAELYALLGKDIHLKISQYTPNTIQPDMRLYDLLAGVLREIDPAGIPTPDVLTGVTDGAFFSKLGIQNYGFLPLDLPKGVDFYATIHDADERVPVAALDFGIEALYRMLQRFDVQ